MRQEMVASRQRSPCAAVLSSGRRPEGGASGPYITEPAPTLGIEKPRFVRGVDARLGEGEVEVRIGLAPKARLACPECGAICARYDRRTRSWRHLDTMQYRTVLTADVPRVTCKEHGVAQIVVPWAEPGARLTALFESLVIDWLREASTSAVAKMLRMSWDVVDGVMSRAVARGLARRESLPLRKIGVDETSLSMPQARRAWRASRRPDLSA